MNVAVAVRMTDGITEDHVLKAIKYIEDNQITLKPSTKYLVEINGKNYPPKEVMRYAVREKSGRIYWDRPGGDATNRILEKMGFKTFQINPDSADPRAELIKRYKAMYAEMGFNTELYKWELLGKFKGRPDTNAENFLEEVKGIHFFNLIYPVGIGVLHHLAKDRTESLRECFKNLFNDEMPLKLRLDNFSEETYKLYREIQPDEKLQHYQDERTMATYLTYHDPETYTFYKSSFYKKYCNLLGISSKKAGEKYEHYLDLVDSFIDDFIREDEELTQLISKLGRDDIFQDNQYKILAQDILYQMLDKQNNNEKCYWRIGTSDETQSYWDYMKDNNVIAIGWSNIGDLNEAAIGSKKDIIALMKAANNYPGDNRTISQKSGEIFHFYNDIKIGDVILAQDGATILGIGIVADDYIFNSQHPFPHQRGVNWRTFNPSFNNSQGLRTTVYQISDQNVIGQIENLINEEVPVTQISQPQKQINMPLNQILFGPPGTGKTYHTINKALEIIGENITGKTRKEIKEIFDIKLKEGQIVFTTFHQSMSYEDFIEGIKPVTVSDSDGRIGYDVLPGIFKKLCMKAKTPPNPSFLNSYENLLNELKNVDEIHLDAGKEKFSIRISENGLDLDVTSNSHIKNITREGLEYVSKSNLFVGKWGTYYRSIFQYLKDKYRYQENSQSKLLNHVLIIDEINRGNVSQIFGELITLIEEDKRIGKEEELEVTLSYSKEKFGVPDNIYIIGTMNTADRSVEALDTALRRRFHFIEMPPKPGLIATEGKFNNKNGEVDGINLPSILRNINKRIAKLLDHNHLIGHSFFMSVGNINDIKSAFQNKIIPLLQEFFFGDYGKIGLVLGKGFFYEMEKSTENIFAAFDDYDATEFAERTIFKLKDVMAMSDTDFRDAIAVLLNE